MFFYSTNRKSPNVNFEDALVQGLAPDGGLYFPGIFPKFTDHELKDLIGKSLTEIGFKVLEKWLSEEIEDKILMELVKKSLDFPIELKKVDNYHLLELFHGPTQAFKDIAAKNLANIMDYFLQKRGKTATVLVATSGDTGGAVAQGFSGVNNVKVVILYPKGKVSKLQEEQLTRVAENITSIEIDGVFDDCQNFVKQAFVDPELKNLNLTSANSINIARLLPQIIYYFYSYSVLAKDQLNDGLEFIVPAGNLGNATAGLFAWKMGLPVRSFVIATNENDSVVKYYRFGKFKLQKAVSTISNAMDIGDPSNFIRVLELFNYDYSEFKKLIKAIKISEPEAIKTIKQVYKKYNYLLDPHTAVGYAAAENVSNPNLTRVIISTAAPQKFASEIKKATGINVSDQEIMDRLSIRKKKKFEIQKDYKDFKKLLICHCEQ